MIALAGIGFWWLERFLWLKKFNPGNKQERQFLIQNRKIMSQNAVQDTILVNDARKSASIEEMLGKRFMRSEILSIIKEKVNFPVTFPRNLPDSLTFGNIIIGDGSVSFVIGQPYLNHTKDPYSDLSGSVFVFVRESKNKPTNWDKELANKIVQRVDGIEITSGTDVQFSQRLRVRFIKERIYFTLFTPNYKDSPEKVDVETLQEIVKSLLHISS